MIELRKHEDGCLQLYVEAEDDFGTYLGINLTDEAGLKLWLEMAAFYRQKGHDVDKLLNNAPNAAPGFWARVRQALVHILGA